MMEARVGHYLLRASPRVEKGCSINLQQQSLLVTVRFSKPVLVYHCPFSLPESSAALCKLGGDDADFWFTKALVYIALPGGEDIALKALKRALKLDPAAEKSLVEYPALARLFSDRVRPSHL